MEKNPTGIPMTFFLFFIKGGLGGEGGVLNRTSPSPLTLSYPQNSKTLPHTFPKFILFKDPSLQLFPSKIKTERPEIKGAGGKLFLNILQNIGPKLFFLFETGKEWPSLVKVTWPKKWLIYWKIHDVLAAHSLTHTLSLYIYKYIYILQNMLKTIIHRI